MRNCRTLVTPMAPTFSPKVLVPLPEPQTPARTVPMPSTAIPLLMACRGGGGASAKTCELNHKVRWGSWGQCTYHTSWPLLDSSLSIPRCRLVLRPACPELRLGSLWVSPIDLHWRLGCKNVGVCSLWGLLRIWCSVECRNVCIALCMVHTRHVWKNAIRALTLDSYYDWRCQCIAQMIEVLIVSIKINVFYDLDMGIWTKGRLWLFEF